MSASTPTSHSVAFIGLGVMGAPMAGHLARAGHRVTVFNRTAAKAEAWLREHPGQSAAPSPREAALAAGGADVVCTCVGNDDDLRAVVLGPNGALAGMKPGSVLVDHSTVSADVARELAATAHEIGVGFVDAPVSGGQSGAQNGQLTILCGGADEDFARVQPVIAAYARAITHFGPVGSGQMAKMVNQIAIAGLIQSLAEAIAFGEKAGLDMRKVLAAIAQGAAQSWQMQNRGPTMIEGRFDFGFAVDWMRKDLALCLDAARRIGAALPVAALVDQFYADVQAAGGGRWDTSALITRLRR